ncbi:MAG TPA: class I SAM-dependent methyltransferase [Rhodocyclaceae bacterium]|nr:class I SAM-dependent methyltransferase [Rhodocyclaceae bacterium]
MKPVSKTAFYCCGMRMFDAMSARPVCGDTLAANFIDDSQRDFVEGFRRFSRQNASTVARHRLIDDHLRRILQTRPDARIITIGAGFDTRPHRLAGGRWVELDEPEVMAFKEERLPIARADNDLIRLPIEFARESLAEKLAPYAADASPIVVLEGVAMYLSEAELRATARAIKESLPDAVVLTDLMSAAFYRRYSRKLFDRFEKFGAIFQTGQTHPIEIFKAEGFRVQAQQSITELAVDAGTFGMPRFLFRHFFPTLREGYSVWIVSTQ